MEQLSGILKLQLDARPGDGGPPSPLLSRPAPPQAPSLRWEPPAGAQARLEPYSHWNTEAPAAGRRGSVPW